MSNIKSIALFGKLGHGKTSLLNKLTGKHFPSNAGARSCTRTLQNASSKTYGIDVIDTPGFYASENIAAHIAAQKFALENVKLSGIYIVVRYSRADEIAEMLTKIMDFIGSDDVRIILTHADVAESEEGYDPDGMKKAINELVGIKHEHVVIVSKNTDSDDIEAFVERTLHEPRSYAIGESQVSIISSLCVGTRKINKPIEQAMAKIQAATNACRKLVRTEKSYETDLAITAIQSATTDMVSETKMSIFMMAEDMEEEHKNLVYGKAGLALSHHLKQFVETTNKCLSWDMTDPNDARNKYKSCPHCNAVFIKTEGCDGSTYCGNVPKDLRRQMPRFEVQFKSIAQSWAVQYFLDGAHVLAESVPRQLAKYTSQMVQWGGTENHRKRKAAAIESGCGALVNWSQMPPVDPSRLKELGLIEVQKPGVEEARAKALFEANLTRHHEKNRQILSRGKK